ncbi:proton-associated sugar transporter A-like [Ctenocephalides felis]|uniref:proton-associated sugar transporter A-like n=1 Tax=Ctenocephalides felis TaxID=7515 RepID=UPI000E6E4F00|nr:proton-associated sugar transporter A-like [Ctenocephalides felis]
MREPEDYTHVFRRKTTRELLSLSCSVMGIEFAYAAETAFVTPALLQIGIPHKCLSFVWALSPFIGFFAGPLLGSMSDRCTSSYGRRRPFIFVLAILIVIGLLLLPNGEVLGHFLGDDFEYFNHTNFKDIHPHRISASTADVEDHSNKMESHKWGVILTILGTVLLDFASDASQSPARAYLVDMCIPEDHARGLSSFTILAGLGGTFGYSLGAIDWDYTFIGEMLGGHMNAVFTLVAIIFILCVFTTLTSFKEIPLDELQSVIEMNKKSQIATGPFDNIENQFSISEKPINLENISVYGTLNEKVTEETVVHQRTSANSTLSKSPSTCDSHVALEEHMPLSHYLKTIFKLPKSIRMICVTNLFCWMAHVCYSLYFTDFVGEAVFHGDPKAPPGSESRARFEQGVRFGCWGMAAYSLSCSFYSIIISKLIKRYRSKKVYVGGVLVYSAGMLMMAIFKNRFVVIVLSGAAGIMYSTLFTMPYLLIAKYHDKNAFETNEQGEPIETGQKRGLGTDIALAGSMVFIAQLVLSLCVGFLVNLAGTTTIVIAAASVLASCGAIFAANIMFLD